MLSGLTSKLRERAKVLMQGHWSDGRDDALLMEDAANTIDRFRCMNNDLSRLKAENDKLRETLREFHACSSQVGCESCGYSGHCETLDTIYGLLGIEVEE